MDYNRREFLRRGAGGLGGLLLATESLQAFGASRPRLFRKIGINVMTIGQTMREDYSRGLRLLKDMGYDYIESRPFGDSVEAYAKAVKQAGLKHLVMGYNLGTFTDDPDTLFRNAERLGVKYLICYNPWPKGIKTVDKDIILKTSEVINEIGKKVKQAGFKFLWHTHGKSFTPLEDGMMPYDLIMTHTDPSLSGVEMDVYWVSKPGADPVEYMNKYPGRAELLHIKDMDGTESKNMCCVGDGIIDFKSITETALSTGTKHLFVEQEKQKPIETELDCARSSLEFLEKTIARL